MKTRIISAAVAIALLLGVLYLHDTIIFNIAFALIGALMVYEVFRATKCKNEYVFLAASIVMAIIAPMSIIKGVTAVYCALAIVIYIAISVGVSILRHENIDFETCGLLMLETLLISSAMFSICYIENNFDSNGIWFVILTLCGAWFADTGAYFAGTFFGKHKLCPAISPKKTVEGLIGGFVANAVLFVIYIRVFTGFLNGSWYIIFAVLGIVCCIFSVIGDLQASVIKRKYDIKDYGNIMPGHGGAMDRFDSVLFVAPFMATVLTLLFTV